MRTTPFSLRNVALLALLLILSACTPIYQGPSAPVILMPSPPATDPNTYPSPQPQPGPYPGAEDKPRPTVIEPIASRPQVAPSAVDSLLDSAWNAYRDTRYDNAVAFAERAQRIDSRRPEVYLILGNCYLAKEQPTQARQMALKGIAFSSSGSATRHKLDSLLAKTNP
ncbi:MAG: hypothetical protein V7721_09405 [Porticoccaceae bacterium]